MGTATSKADVSTDSKMKSRATETVLFNHDQNAALEAKLRELGARTKLRLGPAAELALQAESNISAGWETYYDNGNLALTQRCWWLFERAGTWTLRVSGKQTRPRVYEEVTDVDEILEHLGLAQQREVWRRNIVSDPQKIFVQAGLHPFASFYTECREYTLSHEAVDPSPGAAADHSWELQLVLEVMRFDARYAEHEIVADTLFTLGDKAPSYFKCSLAHFSLKSDADEQETNNILAKLLAENGLDCAERPVEHEGACKKLVAYLQRCRPAHWKVLCRVSEMLDSVE